MHTDEAWAQVNGIEIAYDTFGEDSFPPMVLIAGLSAQMVIWDDEFCRRLAGKGFRVIRFDNRDVGRSSMLDNLGMPDFKALLAGRSPAVFYSLHDMARDTLGLLDVLGIPSAHIAGVSMGGMIAQILGMDHPERVRSLAIIMSSSGDPSLPPPTPEALQFLFRPFPVSREKYIRHFVEMWKVMNGRILPMDEPRLEELGGITFERGVNPAGSARQMAAVFTSGSRKPGLASIKAPVVVIHGQADPLLPLPCGIDIAESIPGSRLKVMPGMGHALPPVVWDEVIAEITENARTAGGSCNR